MPTSAWLLPWRVATIAGGALLLGASGRHWSWRATCWSCRCRGSAAGRAWRTFGSTAFSTGLAAGLVGALAAVVAGRPAPVRRPGGRARRSGRPGARGAGRPRGLAGRLPARDAPGMTTREKLLESTADLLATEGLAGVSARSIAAHAGVNQALVFYHFGTVPELLEAAVRRSVDLAVASYRDRFSDVRSLSDLLALGQDLRADRAPPRQRRPDGAGDGRCPELRGPEARRSVRDAAVERRARGGAGAAAGRQPARGRGRPGRAGPRGGGEHHRASSCTAVSMRQGPTRRSAPCGPWRRWCPRPGVPARRPGDSPSAGHGRRRRRARGRAGPGVAILCACSSSPSSCSAWSSAQERR